MHFEGLKNVFLPTPKIVHLGEAASLNRTRPAPRALGAVKTSGCYHPGHRLSAPGSGHCLLPQQLQERGSLQAEGSADQAEGTRSSEKPPLALALCCCGRGNSPGQQGGVRAGAHQEDL